jgi:hypothetical protein
MDLDQNSKLKYAIHIGPNNLDIPLKPNRDKILINVYKQGLYALEQALVVANKPKYQSEPIRNTLDRARRVRQKFFILVHKNQTASRFRSGTWTEKSAKFLAGKLLMSVSDQPKYNKIFSKYGK